jgi:hypothetical protein
MDTLSNANSNLTVLAYVIYVLFVTGLTLTVARILFRNSREFMRIIFSGRENLAMATNQLFEVGFFLFGFGIGLLWLHIGYNIDGYKAIFEVLSEKVGGFALFIGALLFFNLFLFFRGMKYRKATDAQYGAAKETTI